MLAFFAENIVEHLEPFRALAEFEIVESEDERFPAWDSFETEFVDGTVRSLLIQWELCSFGALSKIVALSETLPLSLHAAATCRAGRCKN